MDAGDWRRRGKRVIAAGLREGGGRVDADAVASELEGMVVIRCRGRVARRRNAGRNVARRRGVLITLVRTICCCDCCCCWFLFSSANWTLGLSINLRVFLLDKLILFRVTTGGFMLDFFIDCAWLGRRRGLLKILILFRITRGAEVVVVVKGDTSLEVLFSLFSLSNGLSDVLDGFFLV